MPKIEVNERALYHHIGKTYKDDEQLEELLTAAKAELDGRDPALGILKIELNDTNRPDLWSTTGLGRQLRVYLGGDLPEYTFFSNREMTQEAGKRVVLVDPGLKEVRPFIAAFEVTGRKIDESTLNDLIQTQEKLCWNFGRKRKSIAMGVYRADLISYPVYYKAVDPDQTSFVPLGKVEAMDLRRIIAEHPKGQEFGSIVAGFSAMPFLTDSNGEVLSFPPIINSAKIGAVEVGNENLFVELTGTDMQSLLLATSIVACDLADAGFSVQPVRIQYPYATPFGREIVTPYYFQVPTKVELGHASRMLGEELTIVEAAACIQRMGSRVKSRGTTIEVTPPEYRNDFLHPVDVVEDIMIGRGMKTFSPVMPSDFTVGRLSPIETFSRKVKSTMVGLGYQEMIFSYLGSERDYVERMYPEDDPSGITREKVKNGLIIQIENPMSENYEFVRNSILPNLLGAEMVSANAPYPHRIFEVGKIAMRDKAEVSGTRTINSLGFISIDADSDFNDVKSQISALLYFLYRGFELRDDNDPRFVPGRAAAVVVAGTQVGIFGELHPRVLTSWGVQTPGTGGELDLDSLLSDESNSSAPRRR